MSKLILAAILIGTLKITSYRAVREQTDSTPYETSTGEKVRAGGCAVSRDLLCGACKKLHHRCKHPENLTKLHYGDWIYVDGYGFRQVNDVMSATSRVKKGRRVSHIPIIRQIDLFVEKWSEEHAVGVRERNVYKIKEIR